MTDKLRVGVIGCGEISGLTTWGYRADERTSIYAIADPNTERAEQRAAEWKAEKVYTDYRKLLDDKAVDIAMIITPHDLHKQMVVDALDAGKHVSVQKPMARNAEECKAMVQAAKRAKGKFQVFECYPFYPPIAKAKELIDANEIGDVSMIRLRTTSGSLQCGWELTSTSWEWKFNQERVGGGTMFDDMHHKYALALFFGGPIEKVSAFIENPGMFLDTPATVMWRHKEGQRYGILDATYSPDLIIDTKYYPVEERVEITGSKGIIWVTRLTGGLMKIAPLIMYRDGETHSFSNIPAEWEDGFIRCAQHFIDCILADKQPYLSAEQGLQVVQFGRAVYKSAEEGVAVQPDSIV
ncbi:MAG: gfo/Idh/MocA family oxidoreductase [Candidatus Abyssobacteria bacterium SURF_17]|uniref:Gfo/Idh/MocA family oxidoreductase n=1 Tax=Candidatus Abyssobacteria bacterium SURF_17 TaxID=2093361 RepID=A0A419ER64_9BACT|nr:MAG: gfo/Idh/MocA family oxidoreductase [Candidatus Abyssubacteria bacterium SURF_17]